MTTLVAPSSFTPRLLDRVRPVRPLAFTSKLYDLNGYLVEEVKPDGTVMGRGLMHGYRMRFGPGQAEPWTDRVASPDTGTPCRSASGI